MNTRCSGTMTESQYLAWIRSALRSKWLRWPPRYRALAAAKKPYKGENKRLKSVYTCAKCGEDFPAKLIEVDHYPKGAGSIRSIEDIGEFCDNLFCETENLRVLCKPCHALYTQMERKGISEEDALIEQKLSLFKKKKAAEQKEILLTLRIDASNITTLVKRVEAYRAHLKEKASAEV